MEPDDLPRLLPHFLPKRMPPSGLLKLYFDRAGIKILCVNTNRNAAKNIAGKKFKWFELTEAELYQCSVGILKLFSIPCSLVHVLCLQKVISRDRFFAITWKIHMSDPTKDTINDCKKDTDNSDCLHRIRPLYDSVCVACKSVYHSQQTLSVDESMEATKAASTQKQYTKNKPTKWGIKLFVLMDNTDYTVDFSIYTGRFTLATGKGISFDAMLPRSK